MDKSARAAYISFSRIRLSHKFVFFLVCLLYNSFVTTLEAILLFDTQGIFYIYIYIYGQVKSTSFYAFG